MKHSYQKWGAVLTACALLVPSGAAFAEETTATQTTTPILQVEDQVLSQSPIIVNGRTYVPFRALFDALGVSVDYDATTKHILADLDGKELVLTAGSQSAKLGDETITLSEAPILKDNTTYLPVRAVANLTGRTVDYTASTKKVNVYDEAALVRETDASFTIYNKLLKNSASLQSMEKTYQSNMSLSGDVTVYDQESGNKKFAGTINFEGLQRGFDLNGTFEVKANLAEMLKQFPADEQSTAEELELAKAMLSAKHQVILSSKDHALYLKSPALSVLQEQSENTWFKVEDSELTAALNMLGTNNSILQLMNNPEKLTLGQLLLETVKQQREMFVEQGLGDYMPSVYDHFVMTRNIVQMIMGDDLFTQSGSTYTAKLDKAPLKARILKFYPEAASVADMFLDSVGSLNYEMIIKNATSSNPSITMKLAGTVVDEGSQIANFDFSVTGDQTNSTLLISGEMKELGKIAINLTAKTTETSRTITLNPPAGASIVPLG